ncbi:MAG: D-aminoacylase [Chloroflexi bacterium]|nr:D-aminoacylase [Chloroflexota bacterium]
MVELLIKNGLIIDGTGSAGYYGAVSVEDNRIAIHRGDVSAIQATKEIDAAGKVVCPGFVDLHSHAGLTILGAPHHDPKVRQGVTTELVGIDGISHAPFRSKEELNRYIWLDSGLNGYPPQEADWLTVSEHLSRYDDTVAINMAIILGNSPIRIWGVGWDDKPATKKQMEDMKAATREALEDGAFGMSTGLDYPPGSYASTEELVDLSKVVAKMGGFYHTHTRAALKPKGVLAPWEEAIEIGERSGIPIHLTHYRQSYQGDGSHLDYLGLVEDNRARGMDVTFDCYSYPYSGTSAVILLPHWAKEGGPERLMAALGNAGDRAKMKREMQSRSDVPALWSQVWLTNLNNPKNKRYDGKSIAEIAELLERDAADALMGLIHSENLGVSMVGLGTNAHTLPAFVSHPYGMIASDAILFGEYPNPRTYGCFPVVLAEFVRAEKHLKLPEAIRKMTSFPAQRLGLPDRGVLRDGFKADIVVFDPKTVKAPATKLNPKQYPVGIEHVVVNGEVVIQDGENTGALPGKGLRRGKPSLS